MSETKAYFMDERWYFLRRRLQRHFGAQTTASPDEAARAAVEAAYQASLAQLATLQRETIGREAAGETVSWESLVERLALML